MLRRLRQGLLVVLLALLLLLAGFSEFNPSTIDLVVAPHRYSILDWELSHLPDKWLSKLGQALPGRPDLTSEERIAQAQEFFRLGLELRRLERQLLFPEAAGEGRPLAAITARSLQEEVEQIKERRRNIQADVEETIESEVSRILEQEGLASPVGVLPPVDAVFSSSPYVLILSPRDRIDRLQTILLKPGLTNEEREEIEERIFHDENLSALVEDTGGVAVYPSVITDSFGLYHAMVTISHEWAHHWLFFHPLGWNFWSSPEMTTLNETVATVVGEELGNLVFTALTGEKAVPTPPSSPPPDPSAFDFRAEMQQTRIRSEALLAQGKIEEAEAYMEERRQLFVANGYLIRKINQAFFAFHGTYATSATSISPIGDQVRQLRERSASLEDFLQTVAQFGSYPEFRDYLDGR